ncbi:MAG: type IV toxin-antitoxin system AbiEi family antitoxin domain-containing protein [Renibacterium sp.]|nr:type IV toxin-antitoxin system AbiEi family antitoxin domain-containing protein [Renibacterium sp.]
MALPFMILSSEAARVGQSPRRLASRAKAGELVRVRRGCYLPADEWSQLSARTRHLVRAAAYRHGTSIEPVFSDQSAAILWNLPLLTVPEQLQVLTDDRRGGRSHGDVHKHLGRKDHNVVTISGFRCTDKIRTSTELAAKLPFAQAVAIIDQAMRAPSAVPEGALDSWDPELLARHPLNQPELRSYAVTLETESARRRALAVIGFGSCDSESVGESMSRAQIHLLRLPPPELQQTFTLPDGRIARTDFYWRRLGIVGEFDGKEKYFRGDWAGGADPGERVYAEKLREDGLRALGLRVVRWTWADMMDLDRLGSLLHRAGLRAEPASSLNQRAN